MLSHDVSKPIPRRVLSYSIASVLMGMTLAAPGAAAGGDPILIPGSTILAVYMVVPSPTYGAPIVGCAGLVSLTVTLTGATFPAVLAAENPNGCMGSLCDTIGYNPALSCVETSLFGVTKFPLAGGNVDTPFVPVLCLRWATAVVDVDQNGSNDIIVPGLVTVTGPPCP